MIRRTRTFNCPPSCINFLRLNLELQRLLDVLTELEKLKPEVQKQVDKYNQAFLKARSPASYSVPSSYSSRSSYNFPPSYSVPSSYNLPSSYNNAPQPDTGVAWPPINRSQSFSGGINQDKVCRIHFLLCRASYLDLVCNFAGFFDTRTVRSFGFQTFKRKRSLKKSISEREFTPLDHVVSAV